MEDIELTQQSSGRFDDLQDITIESNRVEMVPVPNPRANPSNNTTWFERNLKFVEIVSMIVFLGGIIGLYLGWVIPFATGNPIENPQTYIPIIFVTIFVAILLLFFIVLFKNSWGKPTFWKQLGLFLFIFGLTTGIIALISTTGIIGISIVGGLLFLSPLLLLFGAVRQFFKGIWNPLKGFSGSIFGDMANMIGVLAGIGGAKLFPDSAIYWLGHAGAYMAFLVGVSSISLWSFGYAYRNIFSDEDDDEEDEYKFFRDIKGLWLPGLLNLLVAQATFLALFIPIKTNQMQVSDNGIAIFWTVMFGVVLLAFLIFIIFTGVGSFGNSEIRFRFVIPNIILGLLIITNIVLVWVLFVPWSRDTYFPNWELLFAFIVGIIGAAAWIVAEGASLIDLTKEWFQEGAVMRREGDLTGTSFHVLKYLTWEKNLWQILGGLGLIIYLSTDYAGISQTIFTVLGIKLWIFIFLLGAMFSFVGTVRGILSGIMSRFIPK